jgi:aryl-alcohol dehydrogenase-like predicted oxidoreductase
MGIPGRATEAGTARYHARHRAAADHVRRLGALSLSSVGIGTYLGAADEHADDEYRAAIVRAIDVGINVIDAAINYRHQRSERAIGAALVGVARDEIVVCTKGGFIPRGVAPPPVEDTVAGCHCMTPAWLDDQIAHSRGNLGVDTIDVYYVHNPETQLDEVDARELRLRFARAFEGLERACADGRIARYGIATWNGLREGLLDLHDIVAVAREVAGDAHHLAVVQLPLNRRMTEGLRVIEEARDLGLYVMSSASILQGKLPAAEALAWTRTRPGLGTALVGMSKVAHVDANAAVFKADAGA